MRTDIRTDWNQPAANLRWLRRTYGITTEQIATCLVVFESEVVYWELGEQLTLSKCRQLSSFFAVPHQWFVKRDLSREHVFNEKHWRRLHRKIRKHWPAKY